MIVNTLAFVAGVVALQFRSELPPGYALAAVPAALYALRWFARAERSSQRG